MKIRVTADSTCDLSPELIERYGANEKAIEKRLEDKDKKRMVYYKNYTGRAWGVAKNYDLCLNSGVLGMDLCAELIEQAARA